MFVVSMKTTRPRALVTVMVVTVLLVTMLVLSGMQEATVTQASVTDDAGRRHFLQGLGYEVDAAEAQVQEIAIPVETDETFTAYNELQRQAGYDLTAYRGKRVKCWQYSITNYPGAEGVKANIYVYKNDIIGGDVSSTAGEGFCHGLTSLTTGVG